MRNGRASKRKRIVPEEPIGFEQGSGNVFADLGLPNPELALAKAELVRRIRAVIAERKLTQAKAAQILRLDQPKVSALVRAASGGTPPASNVEV